MIKHLKYIGTALLNVVLILTAILLYIIIAPINFFYVILFQEPFTWKRFSGYFRSEAVNVDRYGNFSYRGILNATLIKKNGYQFGDFAETISSVLGKNQRDGTLTTAGKILVFILDKIDKEHCKKSINNFEKCEA